jgi:hypothetical protein
MLANLEAKLSTSPAPIPSPTPAPAPITAPPAASITPSTTSAILALSNVGNKILAKGSNLDGPLHQIELHNRHGDKVLIDKVDTYLEDPIVLDGRFTKEQRTKVEFTHKEKSYPKSEDMLDLMRSFILYHNSGGLKPVHVLIPPERLKHFLKTLQLDNIGELTMMSIKEVVIVILYLHWNKIDLDKVKKQLKDENLRYYGMNTLEPTVSAYLITLGNILRNVPYLEDIVRDNILPNISESYVKWTNIIATNYQSWTSYKDLYDLLESETSEAFESFIKS